MGNECRECKQVKSFLLSLKTESSNVLKDFERWGLSEYTAQYQRWKGRFEICDMVVSLIVEQETMVKNERKEDVVKEELLKSIEIHRDAIGKERDALRVLLSEAEGLLESCDAIDDLESVIEKLSYFA